MSAATNGAAAKPLADNFKAIAFYAVWASLLWLAFGERHQGAVNVLLFCLWAMALLSPFALTDSSIMSAARRPPNPAILRWAARLFSWSTLVLLVWHGHLVTAVAWACSMLVIAAGRETVRKERAKLAGSAS